MSHERVTGSFQVEKRNENVGNNGGRIAVQGMSESTTIKPHFRPEHEILGRGR